MSLSSEDAAEAFQILASTLRDHGYDWVVTQVEEKIALGKLQTRKLRAQDYVEPADDWLAVAPPRRVSRKADVFAVAEEFSPQDRLNILIDALILAVSSINEVANSTFGTLKDFGLQGELQFEPEAEVTRPFVLTHEEITERLNASARLIGLVDELRNGSSNADSANATR